MSDERIPEAPELRQRLATILGAAGIQLMDVNEIYIYDAVKTDSWWIEFDFDSDEDAGLTYQKLKGVAEALQTSNIFLSPGESYISVFVQTAKLPV